LPGDPPGWPLAQGPFYLLHRDLLLAERWKAGLWFGGRCLLAQALFKGHHPEHLAGGGWEGPSRVASPQSVTRGIGRFERVQPSSSSGAGE
jgi:hypothetical protein